MNINSLIGIKVTHKKFGKGVIIGISNDKFADIDFNGQVKKFMIETLEAFVSFEDELDNVLVNNVSQEVKTKNENEKAVLESKRIKMAEGVNVVDSEKNVTVRLGGHKQISFYDVVEIDWPVIKAVFNECDKTAVELYDEFNPKMEYPEMTSRSKSRYCVGFLCKYLNTYVLRVFSRNDVYKKRVKSGITVLQSDTTEIMRIISVEGTTYYFCKNLSRAGGYNSNSKRNNYWQISYHNVILNQVIRKCDCEYLNNYIEERDVSARQFGSLLLSALYDNKAEIVFKHKLYQSAYRIRSLSKYLSEYTSKQIDFACKNDVLNTLPIVKDAGLYDVELLRKMEQIVVVRGWRGSLYENMGNIFKRLGFDTTDLMQRLIRFVKKVEVLDVGIYADFVSNMANRHGVKISDFFDKNYIEIHNQMLQKNEFGYTEKEEIDYAVVAKELSWIDREYKGYHIVLPKCIDDFRVEGDVQHICVFHMGYYEYVINKRSVIVFLRKEKDVPYVTIEFDYETFEVLQARGKYNQELDKELYKDIVDLGKKLHYEKLSKQ